jgi:hypothetical protein
MNYIKSLLFFCCIFCSIEAGSGSVAVGVGGVAGAVVFGSLAGASYKKMQVFKKMGKLSSHNAARKKCIIFTALAALCGIAGGAGIYAKTKNLNPLKVGGQIWRDSVRRGDAVLYIVDPNEILKECLLSDSEHKRQQAYNFMAKLSLGLRMQSDSGDLLDLQAALGYFQTYVKRVWDKDASKYLASILGQCTIEKNYQVATMLQSCLTTMPSDGARQDAARAAVVALYRDESMPLVQSLLRFAGNPDHYTDDQKKSVRTLLSTANSQCSDTNVYKKVNQAFPLTLS